MLYSLGDLVDKLTITNNKMFALEKDIRNGKLDARNTHNKAEKKAILEEIGRRALMIRDLNAQRIAYKNGIDEYQTMLKPLKEFKVDHASL